MASPGGENKCICHFYTEKISNNYKITFLVHFSDLFSSIFVPFPQLTVLQAHTMAPMNLFCTRFLKSLLVKEDSSTSSTKKSQEPQSDDGDNDDDDEDEQMHTD